MTETNKFTLLPLSAIALAFCAASPAHADFPNPKVIMQCDSEHSRMLLRFGTLDARDFAPNTVVYLPQFDGYGVQEAPTDIIKAWASIPFQIGGRCKFRDGRTIDVSLDDGPTSTVDPIADEYLSMSIGQHVVYRERLAYRSNDNQTYPVSAIQFARNKLLECAPTGSDPASPASVCHDETHRLLPGAKLPETELWALRRDRQRETLKTALSPFCRAFYSLPRGQIGDHRFPDAMYVSPSSPLHAVTVGGSNQIANMYRLNPGLEPGSTVIVELQASTRYFDGTVLIAFPKGEKDSERFLKRAGSANLFGANSADMLRRDFDGVLIETIPKDIQARGNVSPRYSQYSLLRYKGSYYVFWSMLDRHSVPSGILSRLKWNGATPTVCRFP